jgi:predicted transcriptional regulator
MNDLAPEPTQNKAMNNHTFLSAEDVPKRVREIAMLRGLGYSFREIGEQMGVTPQAVSLMLSRHRRSIKSLGGALELSQLSTRAVNALGRYGVSSREQAKEKIILDRLRHERNCGRKTLSEIERWLADPSTPN